jgi:hypothetical protein
MAHYPWGCGGEKKALVFSDKGMNALTLSSRQGTCSGRKSREF